MKRAKAFCFSALILGCIAPAASLNQQQILDRWAESLGGRQKLEKVRSVHLKGSIETGGMKGTYERWATSRGEFRTTFDLSGAIRQTTIFDGRQGWLMDAAGRVHELSGGNLRSAISGAYESSHSYFFPGRLPGKVVLADGEASQSQYVLRLEPEGGNPVTVYLDPKTFLPLREETEGPLGDHRTVTFSDWRDFGGTKIPSRVVQSSGDPKFDAVVTTEQVEVNSTLPPDMFTKPAETAARIHFAKGAHQSKIPVEIYARHVFVPVRVNGGEAARFVLDSGAGSTVVTKAWAEKTGLGFEGAMRAVGAAGATSLAVAKNVVLDLGGVELPMPSVTVLDTSVGLPQLGSSADGLLGYDVLSRLVVRIDYEHKEITLYDPAVFVPDGHAAALPITFLGNWPLAPAKITLPGRMPIETQCFIDTGAAGLMFSSPFTNANDVPDALKSSVAGSIFGAGGESKRFASRIAGLELGPYLLLNLPAGFSTDAKEGALASSDIGAIVGGEILERFTVTFDYPHHRILLEPNRRFGDAFE